MSWEGSGDKKKYVCREIITVMTENCHANFLAEKTCCCFETTKSRTPQCKYFPWIEDLPYSCWGTWAGRGTSNSLKADFGGERGTGRLAILIPFTTDSSRTASVRVSNVSTSAGCLWTGHAEPRPKSVVRLSLQGSKYLFINRVVKNIAMDISECTSPLYTVIAFHITSFFSTPTLPA